MKDLPFIIVTGATGALGRNLIHFLLKKNENVVAISRNHTIGMQLQDSGINFLSIDISKKFCLPSELKYCKAIIHCAALSSPWGQYKDFYSANVEGTQNVIALALKMNCPLIHISTPSIYFNFKNQVNIEENSFLPAKFCSFYTETKYLAEIEVLKAKEFGLNATILRPRGIFGPYDSGIIPRILRIAKLGYFPIIDNGEQIIDITFVENVLSAIYLSMNKKINNLNGIEIFNITNNEPKKFLQILDLLFNNLNMKVNYINFSYTSLKKIAFIMESISKYSNYSFEPPITNYTLGLLGFSQTLNIDKAQKILEYKPLYNIEEGIQFYSKWFFNEKRRT